jgi:DNA-binding HxlR family transcriptional regulator
VHPLVSINLQVTTNYSDVNPHGYGLSMSERELATRERASSPLAEALARVGDRWTLLVVQALLAGSRRFNDLQQEIPGIAPNILSERLKRLERDGLLISRRYVERPPRAAYELTAEGMELAGALRLLAHWGARHAEPSQAPRHSACGSPVEARWYCPTCDQLVEDDKPQMETRFL